MLKSSLNQRLGMVSPRGTKGLSMWYVDRSDDLPQSVVLQRKADADGQKRLTDRTSSPASAVEAPAPSKPKVMAAAAASQPGTEYWLP
jgi:hypothetical protein